MRTITDLLSTHNQNFNQRRNSWIWTRNGSMKNSLNKQHNKENHHLQINKKIHHLYKRLAALTRKAHFCSILPEWPKNHKWTKQNSKLNYVETFKPTDNANMARNASMLMEKQNWLEKQILTNFIKLEIASCSTKSAIAPTDKDAILSMKIEN